VTPPRTVRWHPARPGSLPAGPAGPVWAWTDDYDGRGGRAQVAWWDGSGFRQLVTRGKGGDLPAVVMWAVLCDPTRPEIDDRVWCYLAAHGPGRLVQVRTALGYRGGGIANHLGQMARRGRLRKLRRGVYETCGQEGGDGAAAS
jgi:hypothetical protein